MKRRTVLAGAGVTLTTALAGCLGQLVGDDEPGEQGGSQNGDETNENSDDDAPQLEGRHYEIESTASVEDSPLEHEVTVVQPRIDSSDQPLSLDVTVRNTGDGTVRYGEKRNALGLYQRDGDFALYSPDVDSTFDEESGLWYVSEPVAITMEYRVGVLDPGESTTQRLELIYAEGTPSERAPESFSFDLSYGLSGEDGFPEGEDGFEWGFKLSTVE